MRKQIDTTLFFKYHEPIGSIHHRAGSRRVAVPCGGRIVLTIKNQIHGSGAGLRWRQQEAGLLGIDEPSELFSGDFCCPVRLAFSRSGLGVMNEK